MGGSCSNSGRFIQNKEPAQSPAGLKEPRWQKSQNYQNLSDARTSTNGSNSRKGSFSEEAIQSLKTLNLKNPTQQVRQVTLKELSKHNSESSAWTSYKGVVYDVTKYLKLHPGGIKKLLRGCGKECDLLIEIYHPKVKVEELLKDSMVGELVKPDSAETKQDTLIQ